MLRPRTLLTVLFLVMATSRESQAVIYNIDNLYDCTRYLLFEYYDSFKYYGSEQLAFGDVKLSPAQSNVTGIFIWEFGGASHYWRVYISGQSINFSPGRDSIEILIKHKSPQEIIIMGMNMIDVSGGGSQSGKSLLNWESNLYVQHDQGSTGSSPMIHGQAPEGGGYFVIDKIIVALNQTIPVSMY